MKFLVRSVIALSFPLLPMVAWAEVSDLLNDPNNVIILPGAHSNTDEPVKVISVGDGDTLTVSDGEQKTTIRIACIDAPEMKQPPYGKQSRERLLQLAPVGSEVSVDAKDTDRYGRTVAEVFSGSTNLGLRLVEEGHAAVYRQYLGSCEGDSYLTSEQQAQRRKLAFWSQADPVMPWDYRRGGSTAVQPQPRPQIQSERCDPAYTSHCVPPYSVVGDLNCGDLPFGQIVTLPADPHRLDGDKDGIGCEGN